MEHDIPFGNSNRENGTTFLDFPLFLGIFQWDEPTKRVPFTAEPEIPEILTKWKAPLLSTPEFWREIVQATRVFLAVDNGALKIAENKKSKSATKRKFSGNSAIKLSEILIQVQT